jgi:hypothetical protein
VRYIAAPVYSLVGIVRPPGSVPIGYIVIGDILNGKSSLTSLVSSTIGGLAGVYGNTAMTHSTTAVITQEQQQWTAISASSKQTISGYSPDTGTKIVVDTLVQVDFAQYSIASDCGMCMHLLMASRCTGSQPRKCLYVIGLNSAW